MDLRSLWSWKSLRKSVLKKWGHPDWQCQRGCNAVSAVFLDVIRPHYLTLVSLRCLCSVFQLILNNSIILIETSTCCRRHWGKIDRRQRCQRMRHGLRCEWICCSQYMTSTPVCERMASSFNVIVRVTSCLENLEMSGNLTAVREMSGILLKVMEVSGKNLVREKWPELFIVSCTPAYILDFAEFVHFVLVSDHALLHSYPHHWQ